MLTRSKAKMGDLADPRKIVEEVKLELRDKVTNQKIDELIKTINEKDIIISELEGRVKQLEWSYSLLERKADDHESYLRRQNLRIFGIPEPVDRKENGEACLKKVKEEIAKLDVPLDLDVAIDRAHRIGPVKKDDKGKTVDRPMIVRFISWRARTIVYRNRPKYEPNVRNKVRVFTDLTKRRFQLKKHAIERVQGNANVKFVYADVIITFASC